jgi:hypothetical protein
MQRGDRRDFSMMMTCLCTSWQLMAYPNRNLLVDIFAQNPYNIAMEKRRSNRIKINLRAERISGDNRHGIFIENISENGINIIVANEKTLKEFLPGKDVDLRFRLSSGEALNLRCKVKWFCPDSQPDVLTESIGLEIIDPPPRYIEFVRTLS